MDLGDLLTPQTIVPNLKVSSKKQALQELAGVASGLTGIPAREVFDTLLQRERLGSTGYGRGIAIPHVKFKSLERIVCIFARLSEPIDFDSSDGEPVDLVFVLLAPEHASGDHLKALSRISRLIREPGALERVRSAKDHAGILSALCDPTPASSNAA